MTPIPEVKIVGTAPCSAVSLWREAAIIVLAGVAVLLVQGYMAERDAATSAKVARDDAMKLLQNCLNGYPLMTKDVVGRVDAAVFCQPSREVKL